MTFPDATTIRLDWGTGTALLVSEWPRGRSRAQQIETLRRFLLPGLFEPKASRSSAGVEGA
ncbi:MAG: hypothetical protein JRG83_09475 [Deltaproteobacteria bacterium]|nr:hypothetical protein [Deltaproteobacteria bacterium]